MRSVGKEKKSALGFLPVIEIFTVVVENRQMCAEIRNGDHGALGIMNLPHF